LVISQKEMIHKHQLNVIEYEKQLSEYKKSDERNAALGIREAAVAERERNVEIETLKYQLSSEKESKLFAQQVTKDLVRNTHYRGSVYENRSTPMKDQYGSTTYANASYNSNTESKAE
jgi:hypothetical protein